MLVDHSHVSGGQLNHVQGDIHQRDTITNNTTNIHNTNSDGFKLLQKQVATTAFHNSAQRVDPPKCHRNTRVAVMDIIMDWIETPEGRETWIMWLNGAAGAGKSAIAQSIAELCVKLGVTVASFFFFRTDPTRNKIGPLVPTLAYQIGCSIPSARELIVQAIDNDPLIFQKSLEQQFQFLIIDPLRQIGRLPSSNPSVATQPVVLIIDGLDECNGRDIQSNLVRTLSDIACQKDIPLIFLLASRPESHLAMAFNSRKLTSTLVRLALDNTYLPDNDIRLFLQEKFADIRDTHPLAHLLSTTWPPPPLITEIVEKSSGQFIYAAVVMNYVSSPRADPVKSLEVVRGLRPARSNAPFAQLDALYRHIFSQVDDMETARLVLASALFGVTKKHWTATYLGVTEASIESSLSDLISVIDCKSTDDIIFLHASLPDFLCDSARSKEYHIDLGSWGTHISRLLLKQVQGSEDTYIPYLSHFLKRANATSELCSDIAAYVPTSSVYFPSDISVFLSAIKELDFQDCGTTYNHQLLQWVRCIQNDPEDLDHLRLEKHDVDGALAQIILENSRRAGGLEDSKRAKVTRWFKKVLHL